MLLAAASARIEDVFDAVFYWMEIAERADELIDDQRRYLREDLAPDPL